MCAAYTPARRDMLAAQFSVDPRDHAIPPHAYPGSMTPIVRRSFDNPSSGQREAVSAMFGMVPHWADLKLARQTYNSRSETTATKPSFRNAWRQRQFCVIPVASIYEPCYESGRPVRWQISHRDGAHLGIAGIWERRTAPGGVGELLSFSMLTVNADDDPLMQRFHKPNDEKRSVVFLHPDQYDAWLDASVEQAPDFLRLFPAGELLGIPAPRAPVTQAERKDGEQDDRRDDKRDGRQHQKQDRKQDRKQDEAPAQGNMFAEPPASH